MTASAQKETVHQVEEITVINYGDGRLLFREQSDDKAPLNGEHRIIDGYRSEYILAEFKGGMYNGKYQTYKGGKENEEYKIFYEDSTLREQGRSENDMAVYRKEYYSNGKLKSVAERPSGSDGWNTAERYDMDGNKE